LSPRVTFLGTGTSHGVPAIGCGCEVCRSPDPHDRRMRPSILVELEAGAARRASDDASPPTFRTAVRTILVDTSTDLRSQALALDLRRIDAILFTHSHADHIMGLDDVRRFNEMQRGAIACYADARTCDDLRRIFSYVFENPTPKGGGIPRITLFEIAGPFTCGDADVVPIPVLHGSRPILGFRIGTFAYLTDCNHIPDSSWPLLTGVRTLVLDALRRRPHSTHFSLGEALEVVERLKPEQAYFTHICHDLAHAATCASLPAGVELAYDGLVLDV
jgi:phosphoribosyl 1,2-cyclic phosphate phosphodiesterase